MIYVIVCAKKNYNNSCEKIHVTIAKVVSTIMTYEGVELENYKKIFCISVRIGMNGILLAA